MRRFFIFWICFNLVFRSFPVFAGAAATRMCTGVISSISSSGAVYGGASGSRIVVTAARSWAEGYITSPLGTIPAGAAGGYETAATVALNKSATSGLLRLGVQAGKCLGYVGLILTAAQLAGLAWEWYTDENGDSYFREPVGNSWTPAPGGYLVRTEELPKFNNKRNTLYIYNCSAAADAASAGMGCNSAISGSDSNGNYKGGRFNAGDCWKTICYYYPSLAPPASPTTYNPVPWDDVQKQIEDDLTRDPSKWSQPFNDAVDKVPPAVNPWNKQNANESAAQPAPSPTPEAPLPYPVPNATPSPSEFPDAEPLPNQLTKEDISKVMSDILASMTPAQQSQIAGGDVTQPTPNQDLANQIEQIVTNNTYNVTVQGSPNVNVVNTPTVNVSGLAEQLSAIQANQVAQIGKVAEVKTALDLQTQAVVDLATATNAETAKIAEVKADTALAVQHLAGIATNLAEIKSFVSQPAQAPEIPQPPYDVNVLNEELKIKINTEEGWQGEASGELGAEKQPDDNDQLGVNYIDEDKFKSSRRDMSFLDDIYSDIKDLPLFDLFEKRPVSVSGGSSQLCLDIPNLGSHCIDLDDYSSVFDALGQVCVALAFFACLAIVFL
jgi:hypothetical protein